MAEQHKGVVTNIQQMEPCIRFEDVLILIKYEAGWMPMHV